MTHPNIDSSELKPLDLDDLLLLYGEQYKNMTNQGADFKHRIEHKYIKESILAWHEQELLKARIEEHHNSIADFHPQYLISINKQEHLTDVGKAHLRELSDRLMFHKHRIAELNRKVK